MSEQQAPYGHDPGPLNHLYTAIRDAVQPDWFTFYSLAGEPFRIYSPELARRLDDAEEERRQGGATHV